MRYSCKQSKHFKCFFFIEVQLFLPLNSLKNHDQKAYVSITHLKTLGSIL